MRCLFLLVIILNLTQDESYGQPVIQFVEVASGFVSTTDIVSSPQEDDVLYIVQRQGIVTRVANIGLAEEVRQAFMNIQSLVVSGGERGLLGMTFHPLYPAQPYVYVNYTYNSATSLSTQIARFAVDQTTKSVDNASILRLLSFEQDFSNHNGGAMHFGPDGMLYIGVGDGGSSNDPNNRGQDKLNLLGSILRIDVNSDDFPNDAVRNYAIPADNPYVGYMDTLSEIYHFGLRNPWRISFDRSTGDLWIADVGQSAREEVNKHFFGSGGGMNYGWSCREGMRITSNPPCLPGILVDPVFEYDRTLGQSITGGYVYRGQHFDGFKGHYILADYVSGQVWTIDAANPSMVQMSGSLLTQISTFGQSKSGELYAARLSAGTIHRVVDLSDCGQTAEIVDLPVSRQYFSDSPVDIQLNIGMNDSLKVVAPEIALNPSFEMTSSASLSLIANTCIEYFLKNYR